MKKSRGGQAVKGRAKIILFAVGILFFIANEVLPFMQTQSMGGLLALIGWVFILIGGIIWHVDKQYRLDGDIANWDKPIESYSKWQMWMAPRFIVLVTFALGSLLQEYRGERLGLYFLIHPVMPNVWWQIVKGTPMWFALTCGLAYAVFIRDVKLKHANEEKTALKRRGSLIQVFQTYNNEQNNWY